jgi:hypothetical protein
MLVGGLMQKCGTEKLAFVDSLDLPGDSPP